MSDLIDLSSPDSKCVLGPKLASPLIPTPKTPTNLSNCEINIESNVPNKIPKLRTRDSWEDNPFDRALHEATEYIRKKNDPFEVVLENALKSENRRAISSKSCSVDSVGTCNTPHERHSHTLKLNKTLDEVRTPLNATAEEHILNLNKTEDFTKYNNDTSFCDTQHADLSVLNLSAMDNVLWEPSSNNEETEIKSIIQQRISMYIQKGTLDAERVVKPTETLKPLVHYRSLSQGANSSPRKIMEANGRSHSILDTLKLGMPCSDNTTLSLPSIIIDDALNDGFLRNSSDSTSVCSILSNISGITKANLLSQSNSSFLSGFSDGTINGVFRSSLNSEKIDLTKIRDKIDSFSLSELSNSVMNRGFLSSYDSEKSGSLKNGNKNDCRSDKSKSESKHTNSITMTPCTPNTPLDISRIISLLRKTKLATPEQESEKNMKNSFTTSNAHELYSGTSIKKCKENAYDKLLDIDHLTTNRKCNNKERSKSCALDWSSDSVFIEEDKTSQLILHEAKSLADIFDDLAHTTESRSSTDELLSNNPSWMSELLPAFDDESTVEDLIVPPTSPEANSNKEIRNSTKQSANSINGANLVEYNLKTDQNNVHLSETEIVDTTAPAHKASALALLLDLKKIVRTEHNPEADQLLDNLEKVLGVQYKDNSELLVSCLQASNNLAKSPARTDDGIITIENVKVEDVNKTQDDNLNVDSIDNGKEERVHDKITMNNLNSNEIINKNGKSPTAITSDKSPNILNKIDTINENSPNKSHESPEKCDKYKNLHEASYESPSDSMNCDAGEKVALDLLANLSKLLSGQCQEPAALRLIKNLGTVLNLVSSTCIVEDCEQTDQSLANSIEGPEKNKRKIDREDCTSALSRSISELTSKIKASAHKSPMRRMSLSQTTPTKTISDTPLATSKNKTQFKNVKKRFSSDPGFINSVCGKKGIDASIQKNVELHVREANSIGSSDHSREKNPAAIHAVKSRLKKKVDTSVVSKKGPLKAILPVGSMQRAGSTGKKTVSTEGSITPPSSKKKRPLPVLTVVTSTPDSLCGESMERKSPKTRPVASSTPDIENSRMQKGQLQLSLSSKKRNFNCDISPVSTQENDAGNNGKIKDSPKRTVKLSSPRRTTGKTRQSDTGLPKYFTSPGMVKRNYVYESSNSQRRSEYGYKSTQDLQKGSPISLRRTEDKRHASPLKESNKLTPKMKGVNLASKLRRHSSDSHYIDNDQF